MIYLRNQNFCEKKSRLELGLIPLGDFRDFVICK